MVITIMVNHVFFTGKIMVVNQFQRLRVGFSWAVTGVVGPAAPMCGAPGYMSSYSMWFKGTHFGWCVCVCVRVESFLKFFMVSWISHPLVDLRYPHLWQCVCNSRSVVLIGRCLFTWLSSNIYLRGTRQTWCIPWTSPMNQCFFGVILPVRETHHDSQYILWTPPFLVGWLWTKYLGKSSPTSITDMDMLIKL